MEATSTPSTSKVILQCTDPSNLIEPFESRLTPRTPLKNLHWKSPSRPLRSIPSLNISLVRKDASQAGTGSAVRRHQIPGLRETPYVKLYLLRCDDKEIYKETARKEIKQWIKDNTFEKESKSSLKNHEHHDAFEWMIVHVVVPGTAAASQPASSKHLSLNDTESTDSLNSKSKWTGKSTSTIYDKLRADFSSSKLSIPRVAQVRLTDPGKPPGALAPSEIEEQWHDFVDNLKATILKSFDTRVAQYEDDIREREGQRSLPGWNFCTFFMLKEGLARGFENVGLLDDALNVYAELEIGLDTVVKEHASRDEGDVSGALLPYSNDLKANIRRALDEDPLVPGDDSPSLQVIFLNRSGSLPFDASRRNYRDMILANDVSPLDVRTYIFTRQVEILLRRARTAVQGAKDAPTDMNTMAELAELALNFINLGSRELRIDMQNAWGGRIPGEERVIQKVVIGNAVASWTWLAVVQILGHILPIIELDLAQFEQRVDVLEEDARLESKTLPRTPNGHSPTSSASSSPQRGLRPESLSRTVSRSPAVPDETSSKSSGAKQPGLERLLSTAARLFLLARKTLENLPAATKWVNELRDLDIPGYKNASRSLHRLSSAMTLPTSNGVGGNHNEESGGELQSTLRGLEVPTLAAAVTSQEHFCTVYRLLSQVMHHLYVEASNKHSARQVLIDLAMLSYSQGDLAFARQCLSSVVGPGSQDPLVAAQPHVLALYAECLKDAEQPNDLAQCLLACLRASSALSRPRASQRQYDQLSDSAKWTSDLRLPLNMIMEVMSVDRAIAHRAGQSGFSLSMSCRASVPVELHSLTSATLKLRALEQQDPMSLWLECSELPTIGKTLESIEFSTSISTEGWYAIEYAEVWLGKLRFEHNFQTSREAQTVLSLSRRQLEVVPIRAYLPSDSFRMRASQTRLIDVSKRRSLTLKLSSSSYGMSDCALRIKPRTAGLRLALHEAKLEGDAPEKMQIVHENDATFFRFQELTPETTIDITISYTLESMSEALAFLKCTLEGAVEGQRHVIHQTCSLDVSLPISVNVQDVYRVDHWYSHFLVAPATAAPVSVIDCRLEPHPDIDVDGSEVFEMPVTVFPQHALRWLARLSKKDRKSSSTCEPLHLNVRYHQLDEIALASAMSVLRTAATQAGFAEFSDVLCSHLTEVMLKSWTEQDLEMIGLTHEVHLLEEADSDWEAILGAFKPDIKSRLRTWLQDWHKVQSVPLELDNSLARELRVNVEIRPAPTVVTTELQPRLPRSRTTAALGQPVTCTLKIEVAGKQEKGLQYTYELYAASEAWLVGGKKKGLFSESEGIDIPVVLFPQRLGLLMLPSVDVRCKKQTSDAPQGMDGGLVDVPIEIHNRTIATTVQVTSNLHSATTGLAAEDAPSQASTAAGASSGLLLRSQGRSDG